LEKIGFNLVRRLFRRARRRAALLGNTIYWGWVANQEMSDEAFLAQLKGQWTGVDQFLDHLASRPNGSWLLRIETPEQTQACLGFESPGYLKNLIAAADAACAGEFNLLGHPVRYPKDIDWQQDPLSGWRWPVQYRERLDRLVWAANPPADLTLIWELNRHQHFSFLGIAYYLTQDERYSQAFSTQAMTWIEQNPLQHGIHWHSSLEVGLRVIAWTVALQFFCRSPRLRGRSGALFVKSLYRQVNFIRGHLQTRHSAVPNNHLVAELAALAIAGAVFPEFNEAGLWQKTAMEMLAEHILLQTHLDGVNKEQATGYHRFVTELLCILVTLGKRGALGPAPILAETLEKMFDYLQYAVTPGGRLPQWGDCGYARALGMEPGEDYFDPRWLLAVGAVLFRRPDWKHTAGRFGAQAFWLLGEEGYKAWKELPDRGPSPPSRKFSESGMFILRSDWGTAGDLCFFRSGPFGLGDSGACAHAHCDLLSPMLWIQGRALLVDPGTYLYSGPWRDLFRTTGAHNTLMVDGHEQADPLNLFGWKNVPEGWAFDWVAGQHVSGGIRAAPRVYHTRQVVHLTAGNWQINDRLEGEGYHQLAWNFQLAPGLNAREDAGSGKLAVEQDGLPFVFILAPAGVRIEVKSGWVSRLYGVKDPAPRVVGEWQGEFTGGALVFSWKFIYSGEFVPGGAR
jgi:hypothetical protein